MNNLITSSTVTNMSSREIAELVEKRHDNVKRTIETLADRGVIQLPQSEEVKNHLGQIVTEYLVEKRDSYVVVAQLSPEFTARLVDRWQELESAPALDLNDPGQLRELLSNYAERTEIAEAKVADLVPKAAALEIIEGSEGSICISNAGKVLEQTQRKFFSYLNGKNWIFKRDGRGSWIGYSDKVKSGYIEHTETVVTRHDGSTKTVVQALITQKGLVRLAKLLEADSMLEGGGA